MLANGDQFELQHTNYVQNMMMNPQVIHLKDELNR